MNAKQKVNKLEEDIYNVISKFEDETGLTVNKVEFLYKEVYKDELDIKQIVVSGVKVSPGVS